LRLIPLLLLLQPLRLLLPPLLLPPLLERKSISTGKSQ
jgi:hypothetical protein